MKKIALMILALACVMPLLPAASLGPDVAVVLIRVGREKQLRRVVIGLYDDAAPQTVENFKKLVTRKYYNGMRFHRVFPDTLIQTGDPDSRHGERDHSGTGGPGYTLPAEITSLKQERGAVVTARLPDAINPSRASSGSQFYICLKSMPNLDGKYTVFGQVLDGIDVVEAISRERVDSNDFPVQKIVIKSIKLEPRGS